MAVIGEILFLRSDHAAVSDVVRAVDGGLAAKVDAYDERRFDAQSDDEVVDALGRDNRIEPLEVDFEGGKNSADEITLSVRDVFGGGAQVPGLRVAKSVPFKGDADLWRFGTGQWSTMMPRGDVRRGQLIIGMDVRTTDTDSAVRHIKETIEEIKGYLAQQRGPIDAFNSSLRGKLLPLVQARRARRGGARDLLDRF